MSVAAPTVTAALTSDVAGPLRSFTLTVNVPAPRCSGIESAPTMLTATGAWASVIVPTPSASAMVTDAALKVTLKVSSPSVAPSSCVCTANVTLVCPAGMVSAWVLWV